MKKLFVGYTHARAVSQPFLKRVHPPLFLAVCCTFLFAATAPASAAWSKLFSDLGHRFPVGDPNATNPLADRDFEEGAEGPKALVAVDLNRDLLTDLVVGNLDGSVSVLLGQGGRNLEAQILIPAAGLLTNSSIRALAAADFNGDQIPDVAAADISRGGVILLLGTGDGHLVPTSRLDLGPARALAAADFNQDGSPDLLVACAPPECVCTFGGYWTNHWAPTQRFVAVLRNQGNGTFANPEYLLSPGIAACFYDVAAADLDQDGAPEALALDFSITANATNPAQQRLFIFQNRGDGTFSNDVPDRVLISAGQGPRAFALGYIDERLTNNTPSARATLDVVIANRDSSSLDIFLNRSNLVFAPPITVSAGDSPRDVAIGDLDSDGFSDLVVVNRNQNTISVLPGFGTGRFGDPGSGGRPLEFPTGVSPRQVALADLDGDGALDAAVNNRLSEDVSVFFGQAGLLGFLLPEGQYPAGFTPVSIVAEDFNGDLFPDMATANLRSHEVRVRLNRGTGQFGSETIYPVEYGPVFLAAGDLNADQVTDLVVTCLGPAGSRNGGSLVTLLGQGDGSFPTVHTMSLTNSSLQPYWMCLADLSGDALLDAVVSGLHGELAVFRGRGDGRFDPGIPVGLVPDGRPLGLAVGDFDRDGKVDIACSRGWVFFNDDNFFTPSNAVSANRPWTGRTSQFVSGTQAWATETADLDGDQQLDLMVALTFRRPDPIGVLSGQPGGQFAAPTVYEGPDVGAVAIIPKDMDGDGLIDLVVGNRCAATVLIMRGRPDHTFELVETIRALAVEDVAVADVNRDGKPDLLGVGVVSWCLLNGGTNELALPRSAQVANAPARSGVFLNEIMPLNREFFRQDGSTPDWIELYNHSSVSQRLAGWSITQINADGESKRWSFPTAASIPPYGYLVVFCKKNPVSPGYFASFELAADGETLLLQDSDGREIDRLAFPPTPQDISYARIRDGSRFFSYNPSPTLGSANARPANFPPSIERKQPFVSSGARALALTGRVFDDVAIAYAAVNFRLAGSNSFVELPLNDDGRSGDIEAGDGYFGALLTNLPPGSIIEYYLRVVDLEGQVDFSPDDVADTAELYRVKVPQPTGLRLTELVADNLRGLTDEQGQAEDWLELANTTTTSIALDPYVLTKDYFDRSLAWRFPEGATLAPGAHLVVFCDGDPDAGSLHTNFRLPRSGDRVFLVEAESWTIVDSLTYGPLPRDVSFGLVNDTLEPRLLLWPTPAQPNSLSLSPPADAFRIALSWQWQPRWNGLALRWMGTTNAEYRIQRSESFPDWADAPSLPVELSPGLFEWLEWDTAAEKRFYRLHITPRPNPITP